MLPDIKEGIFCLRFGIFSCCQTVFSGSNSDSPRYAAESIIDGTSLATLCRVPDHLLHFHTPMEARQRNMAREKNSNALRLIRNAGVELLLSGDDGTMEISSMEEVRTCLLFSAHWSRHCRSFIPKLVQLYRAANAGMRVLEVILVSLDRDGDGFRSHFGAMPWLAVPFDASVSRKICCEFGVDRIPSLLPLGDADGEDGVRLVVDYGDRAFPFGAVRRRELEAFDDAVRNGGKVELLLEFLVSRNGAATTAVADLAGKTVGLYFGARWSPPCRAFAAALADAYEELRGRFEVVFVSHDRNESEWRASIEAMPWLAVPYGGRARDDAKRIFRAARIPSLVIVAGDGSGVVRWDGRDLVSRHGAAAFPFTESAVEAAGQGGRRLARPVKKKEVHEHELEMQPAATAYVCDGCRRHGWRWSLRCQLCDFDLHPTTCALDESLS